MNQKFKSFRTITALFNSLRFFFDKLPEKGESPDYQNMSEYLEKLRYYHGIGTYMFYVADLRKLQVVEVGGSLQKLTGLSPDKLINRNFAYGLRIFFLDEIPDVLRCMIQYHKYVYTKPVNQRLSVKGSIILKVKNGKGGHFKGLLQAAPLALDSKGHVAMMFSSITDITHFKLADELLKVDIIDESDSEDIKVINIMDKKSQVVLNLSKSEIRILEHLKQGRGTKEIADVLFLSEHTVNNHRRNMLKKTNVKNTAELISKALPLLI